MNDARGLKCPSCGSPKLQTTDTRPKRGTVRRKRKCANCGHRFFTTEVVESGPLTQERQMP